MADIQREIEKRMAEIPQFFGDKSKDKISAMDYIMRVDQAKEALGWTQAQTYNFAIFALQGKALTWINTKKAEKSAAWVSTWEAFKPIFKTAYGETLEYSKIVNHFKNLEIGHDEEIIDYNARLGAFMLQTFKIGNGLTAQIPANQADRTQEWVDGVFTQAYRMAMIHMKNLIFVSNMPEYVQTTLLQKDIKDSDDIVDTAARLYKKKKNGNGNGIHQLNDEEDVDAAQQYQRPNGNRRGGYQSGRGGQQRQQDQRVQNGGGKKQTNGNKDKIKHSVFCSTSRWSSQNNCWKCISTCHFPCLRICQQTTL